MQHIRSVTSGLFLFRTKFKVENNVSLDQFKAVCSGGRGPRPGPCVPSFLDPEETGLGRGQLLWALKLKEGTAQHRRSPSEGAPQGENMAPRELD